MTSQSVYDCDERMYKLIKTINLILPDWRLSSFLITLLSTVLLISCTQQSSMDVLEEDRKNQEYQNLSSLTVQEQGQRLSDAASKSRSNQASSKGNEEVPTISESLRPFVGRYHTEISCNDPIVNCTQGDAEFILNLLEDGTAHRTIVHLGKISTTTNDYFDDHWTYDESEQQIIIHRSNGLFFFYNLDAEDNLIFNIPKTIDFNELNRAYFAEGNPIPLHNYTLQKVK